VRRKMNKRDEKMSNRKTPFRINFKLMEQIQLREVIDKAFSSGKYLGFAVIQFQKVDWLLRLSIAALMPPDCPEQIVKRVLEQEDRFSRLINYFDLLKPDNGFSDRLLDFNNRRNNIIHKLLYAFESYDTLQDELKKFCEDGIRLFEDLSNFLDPFISKGDQPR
jgi:hypothetical protein